jgi:hypothetical protein
MDLTMLSVALGTMLFMLFLCGFAAIYGFIRAVSRKRRRIRLAQLRDGLTSGVPPAWLLLLCAVRIGERDKWAEWRQLLAGAGLRVEVLWYVCLKRMGIAVLAAAASGMWMYRDRWEGLLKVHPILPVLGIGCLALGLISDRLFLESMKRHRTNKMMEEIFAVSRQLLYFAGSPLHLHGKLARCTPYTRLIRRDWQQLLNDWYYDADEAISRFRYRLGTEEAYGFAETLQSLRQYDNEAYYSLLRQRVEDFKEKLELLRDSRKESVSYVLFVLAGMPVMYTFQIFIHPWVQEGKRLFDSLQ